MLTISFAILIYSMVKIRNFIIYNGLRNVINSQMMCLHLVCFGSYVAANILLFVEIIFYSFGDDGEMHGRVVMFMWIINLVLTFITQTTLILIFLEIGKMSQPVKQSKKFDNNGNVCAESSEHEVFMMTN